MGIVNIMLIVVFNILGFLALFVSLVPLGVLVNDNELYRKYWPTADPDMMIIGLFVALVLLGMARIMAELNDIKQKLEQKGDS